MKEKLPKGEKRNTVPSRAPTCAYCQEIIILVRKDPLYWLYQLIKTRKRPESKIWIHSVTDSEWCRLTKASPLSDNVSTISWEGWNTGSIVGKGEA